MLRDIIDVCSRKLVGREITKTATTNDALKAIKRTLIENYIYHELIPTNSPNYNAHIESFHFLLSKEYLAYNEIEIASSIYIFLRLQA